MKNINHVITFKKECTERYSENSPSSFSAALSIYEKSPGQFTPPCPNTILAYESNSQENIDIFVHYGTVKKEEYKEITETKDLSISPGNTVVSDFATFIKINNFQPLNFSTGCNCSSSPIIQPDNSIQSDCHGLINVTYTHGVHLITIELKWPNNWESTDPPNELVSVCQAGHQTVLSFPYKLCTVSASIDDCKSKNPSNFKILAPDTIEENSSYVIAVSGGTPPISWSAQSEFGSVKIDTSHEGKTRAVMITKDVCSVSLAASDACGFSATKTIKATGCCPDFDFSLKNAASIYSILNNLTPGRTVSLHFKTSGEGQVITWGSGQELIVLDWASPDYGDDRLLYLTVKQKACAKPFDFTIKDNCNDSTIEFTGQIKNSKPCCPPDIPTTWDNDNPQTIHLNGSVSVKVSGSLADDGIDFIWSLSGQGYTFSNGETNITGNSTQIIHADDTACGTCDMTVVDVCENTVSGSVRNIDRGYWRRIASLYTDYWADESSDGPPLSGDISDRETLEIIKSLPFDFSTMSYSDDPNDPVIKYTLQDITYFGRTDAPYTEYESGLQDFPLSLARDYIRYHGFWGVTPKYRGLITAHVMEVPDADVPTITSMCSYNTNTSPNNPYIKWPVGGAECIIYPVSFEGYSALNLDDYYIEQAHYMNTLPNQFGRGTLLVSMLGGGECATVSENTLVSNNFPFTYYYTQFLDIIYIWEYICP